nr:killer suppression protein HigA [Alcaligenes faecalis]
MRIGFNDEKVRKICEQHAVAVKKLGDICSRKLQMRLAELEAASCVKDLVAGNPHPLTGDRAGEFAVDLHRGFRLTFTPGNDPCPVKADGGIDWDKVTIISIEYIGDYHD